MDYADHSEDLMTALIDKLYKTITGNDANVKIPRNKFVTWLLPGVPCEPEDFMFCAKGLGAGITADEDKQMYQQAFYFSKLFDFIPEINDPLVYTGSLEQSIFTTTQDTISSVYNDILKYSQVVDQEITPEQQAKINKFRDLMTVTKEVRNIITDELELRTEPGPITLAYETKMKEYIDVVNEYMSLLIGAQGATGSDSEAKRRVSAWANMGPILRKKVNAAYDAWISQGYKNEYEQMNAFINQITQRSMVLYKKDLQEKFERSRLSNPGAVDAGDFYYTTLLPGNFATSGGWTEFTFYEKDYEDHYERNAGHEGSSYRDESSSRKTSSSSFSNSSSSQSSFQKGTTKKSTGLFKTLGNIAGGAVGSFVGGPVGTALGSALGGALGNAVGGAGGGNGSSESSSESSSNSGNNYNRESKSESRSGSSESSFEKINIKQESKKFSAKFKFTQVPICRPFMDPGIFAMRGWKLSEDWFEFVSDKTISDGADEPIGRLVAYPISALFIKDIEFTFDENFKNELVDIAESNSQSNETMAWGIVNLTGSSSTKKQASSDSSSSSSTKSGGFLGLGSKTTTTTSSYNANASSSSNKDSSSNRENTSSSKSSESSSEIKNTHLIETEDGKGLRIPGMQLIGFINNFVPKCPNTNPNIAEDRFV